MKCIETIEKMDKGKSIRIVALGDSLTYGWMVEKGYIDFLDEMLKKKYPKATITIINRGLPGDTSRGGLFRLQKHVIEENPDLVLLQFALNDALTGFTVDEFYSNMKSMVEQIQQDTSAEILLMTSPLIYDRVMQRMAEPYYGRIITLAAEKKLPLAQVHEYWGQKISGGVEHRGLVQDDLAHPTVEGHLLMAEAVMEML